MSNIGQGTSHILTHLSSPQSHEVGPVAYKETGTQRSSLSKVTWLINYKAKVQTQVVQIQKLQPLRTTASMVMVFYANILRQKNYSPNEMHILREKYIYTQNIYKLPHFSFRGGQRVTVSFEYFL